MNQAAIASGIAGVMAQAVATGLFVSLCTVQRPSGTLGSTGAPDGMYVDVSGLVAIPCMSAVPSVSEVRATEVKTVEDIAAKGYRHVLLNSYYPQILANWRAIVDTIAFDILGVENDSQAQMTRLELQLVQL